MEFAACHLSGASIYELVPRFIENLLAPAKFRRFETIFVKNQTLFVSLLCTVATYFETRGSSLPSLKHGRQIAH